MSKVKIPENTALQDNAIAEFGKSQRDSKNLEDKINIDGGEVDDDDDLYNGVDILENFEPVAFYFIKRERLPRLFFIHLVSWSYFERISIFVILCNCVTLGLFDPFDDDCVTRKCQILEKIEFAIYVFFVVEMLCKWMAMGIFGKLGYLADNWNKLDFFIVAAGTFEIFYDKGKYMTAVRAIRVLRPLRAINRVPSIRILVTLLLDTLPMLGNVLAMCSLIFTIFGIVGVQMWQGLLRNRCKIEMPTNLSANDYNLSTFYVPSEGDFVCSPPEVSGMKRCSSIDPYRANGRDCSLDYETYLETTARSNHTNVCVNWNLYYSNCTKIGLNPVYNTISFDNILIAWVAIFQVWKKKFFTEYPVYRRKAQLSFFLRFCFLQIGSYFMTNLCLVVITTQFQETKQRENDLMRQSRRKHATSTSTIASSRFGRDGCWIEILKYIGHVFRRTKRRLGKTINIKCSKSATHKNRVAKKRKRRKKKLVYHHHHHHHHYHHFHHHVHCPGNGQYLDGYYPLPEGYLTPNLSTVDFSTNNGQSVDIIPGNTLTIPGQVPTNNFYQGEGREGDEIQNGADLPGTVPNISIVAGSACSVRPSTTPKMGEMVTMATAAVNINGQPALSDVAAHSFVSAASLSSAAATATASAAAASMIQNACECAVNHADKGINVEEFESEFVYEGEESETDYSDDDFDKDERKLTPLRKLRHTLRVWVDSKWFMYIIMGAISVNTLSMGIEYYGQEQEMTDTLEYLNYIFTAIFFLEMLLKLAGLGVYGYIKDAFNLFDGTIVIISIVELFGDGNNSISVLRSFRLLRIFKIVRFLPALKRQLLVMIHTLDNVMTFLALLCIFIFTASILGMNLFGGKYNFPDEDARANFDDLFWAIVTVFQVLTQEDWNVVMTNGMRAIGKWAGLYFILLMTIGNYILFNLLVAILVEGFANQPDKGESSVNLRQATIPKFENQIAKRQECSLEQQSKYYGGSKPRVCISPTPSVYYVDQLGCKTYDGSKIYTRRSSLPVMSKSRYPEVAPAAPRSCLSPSPSRKFGKFFPPKGRTEVFVTSPSQDEEEEGTWTEGKDTKTEEEKSPDESVKASSRCCAKRSDWSLFIFSPDNKFRALNMMIYKNKWFDRVVLFFILLNCVVMALEGPSVKEGSMERRWIDIFMYIFLAIFTLEMMIKVVAKGMWIGEDAYLRSGWNVMDGFLVIVSWIDVIVTLSTDSQNNILGVLRVFRALRTLRPLRVISRAPGIKIVVETLISSLKPIGNIVLIAATFFIIFGILGVQLFKGKFHHCVGASGPVTTKAECIEKNGEWKNKEYNFDNLAKALLTLFVFATKDGWVSIMYDGIDAVGIDKQPIKNYSQVKVLYFVAFLLLAGFVVLNMLVGVVVENFQKCRGLIEMERNEEEQKKKEDEKKRIKQCEEEEALSEHFSQPRRFIHHICTHGYFDLAIAAIIGLNVICMALEHYNQPKALGTFLESANYVFTAIFILEAILKIYAMGFRIYFRDKWNHLDMLIVILSVVGIVLEEMNTKELPINPTIIRVMRVLRIARVLKLLKTAEGIRKLLDTVLQALPQVANLGLLFLLLFFIFAALGIELFGRIDCKKFNCEGMDEHAHFQDFGVAMLTLFRISTGDNWNGILKDTINEKICEVSPDVDCKVLEHVAPIYFAVFVLATQFVLLNVVVAVLMKHLEEAKEEDNSSTSGSRNSITSSRKDSKEQEEPVVTLKVPPSEKFRKVSFDDDSGKKENQATVDITVPTNRGQGVLPLVAVNGEDVNHSDSEYSTTSPIPQTKVMEHQKPVLSQSTPTLRPVLRTRNRSSSAAPRIVKEISSSSSLAKLSPILGRLAKSRRFDDSDELVSRAHAHTLPPLEFSGMTNHASENDLSPEGGIPLSPRAPIYKMSEDSDLYDSNLEGDYNDSSHTPSSPRPLRPSIKSNTSGASSTSGSSSSSYNDDRHQAPTNSLPSRCTENAWGTPKSGSNRSILSSFSGRRRSSKGRRPSAGESRNKRSNKKQSYV
ncbi:voltage-dependent T-type calcium channel subunit alpha-1H-like [Actinia tenebrosa]|uniref:Voltage-dependent T-type calcium channel subunit alpha-1H-like n=1 Tax=Actinia tenebrosa TaxID=6105 RepID=A0A6P8IWE0_ACTTE|nr:voltage-dependent T-type calcium channel subunit alpha-1H-like [Actinia tenebrosa]